MTELGPRHAELESPLPTVNTQVWECTNEDCNGWMRKDMALEDEPCCPICQEKMRKGTRKLPELKRRFKRRFHTRFKFPH
jgi:hypothetical protein